jgi:hypothetical protein
MSSLRTIVRALGWGNLGMELLPGYEQSPDDRRVIGLLLLVIQSSEHDLSELKGQWPWTDHLLIVTSKTLGF